MLVSSEVLHPIDEGLQPLPLGEALSQVAHPRGPAHVQQQERNHCAQQKIPQDQPVAAFEIRIGARLGARRHQVHVGVGGRVHIEVVRRLRGCWHLGNVRYFGRCLRHRNRRKEQGSQHDQADRLVESRDHRFTS